jgi:hypothetical protein
MEETPRCNAQMAGTGQAPVPIPVPVPILVPAPAPVPAPVPPAPHHAVPVLDEGADRARVAVAVAAGKALVGHIEEGEVALLQHQLAEGGPLLRGGVDAWGRSGGERRGGGKEGWARGGPVGVGGMAGGVGLRALFCSFVWKCIQRLWPDACRRPPQTHLGCRPLLGQRGAVPSASNPLPPGARTCGVVRACVQQEDAAAGGGLYVLHQPFEVKALSGGLIVAVGGLAGRGKRVGVARAPTPEARCRPQITRGLAGRAASPHLPPPWHGSIQAGTWGTPASCQMLWWLDQVGTGM